VTVPGGLSGRQPTELRMDLGHMERSRAEAPAVIRS